MRRARVLFVCIGNSCRSQMAEGFARTYGADVLEASSAGTAPASSVSPLTLKVMREKNIDVSAAFPKSLAATGLRGFDRIVNMSGEPLPPEAAPRCQQWRVRDPIGEDEDVFRQVRDEIENLVMRLVLDLRAAAPGDPKRPRA